MQLEDEFGDIISKAAIGCGLTAPDLARRVSLSEADLREMMAYRSIPDRHTIDKLACALGLDAQKLDAIANNAWLPNQPDFSDHPFIIQTIRVPIGEYSENCYIIACRSAGCAAVVDPGGAADEIAGFIKDHGLDLSYIFLTHFHFDHIGGLVPLLAYFPDALIVSSSIGKDSAVLPGFLWQAAEDNQTFNLGKMRFTSLATPGHTPESTCYATNSICFVGDTIFAGSIGRPAGSSVYREMFRCIQDKVLILDSGSAILSGHGPITSIAEERSHNPFF